jgi:hypothetical protein
MVWRGNWRANGTYDAQNVVFHVMDGQSDTVVYVALAESGGIEPGTDTSTWLPLFAKL